MAIKPDHLTFDNLTNGRLFRIPQYQRAYSWQKKQRDDLFNDILKAREYGDDRHHFMATVVCLKHKKMEEVGADEFGVFDVVDGQQRITTLVILLKAISQELIKGDDLCREEANKLKQILVKRDDRLILLQTNHDSSSIFREYLKEGIIPDVNQIKTMAEKNLYDAFNECKKFVEKSDNVLHLLRFVKNRLDFIFYVLEDEGTVYTTFEVLNSRGLDVDWLDKCKSILMGIAFEKFPEHARKEQITEIHKVWENIYELIGIRNVDGDEILRFTYALHYPTPISKFPKPEQIIDYFKKYCTDDHTKIIDISSQFKEVLEKLEELESNPRITAVIRINHARFLALAIKLNRKITQTDRDDLLKEWEHVTFRIFGLARKDSRTKVGEYIRLAHQLYNNTTEFDEIKKEIKKIGEGYGGDQVASELIAEDCYSNWAEDLRYFLSHYEEYLAKKQGVSISDTIWAQVWNSSTSKTIEHILPQTLTDEWIKKFGKKDVENQIHRLGNLIVLPPGINSKAKNKSFAEKKGIYKEHLGLKLVDEITSLPDWNKQALEDREERLVEWANKYWK